MPATIRDSILNSSYGKQLQKFLELENPGDNIAQHNLLIGLQNEIKIALEEYCAKVGISGPNVSDDCYILSWMGLDETLYYKSQFNPQEIELHKSRWEADRTSTVQSYSGGIIAPLGSKNCL